MLVGVLDIKCTIIMEPRSGVEPETSSLPWMRSTNWAIAAYYSRHCTKYKGSYQSKDPTTCRVFAWCWKKDLSLRSIFRLLARKILRAFLAALRYTEPLACCEYGSRLVYKTNIKTDHKDRSLYWCWKKDSNLRSRKAGDLQSPVIATTRFQHMEPLHGLEPWTYCLQNSCSNQLS